MPRALRSLSTIPTDERERLRKVGPSILSRKSDEAGRDHGHHHRSSTRRHIVPATQRASICAHSNAPALPAPVQRAGGFPEPLHGDHFWVLSLPAQESVALQSSLPPAPPHPSYAKCPSPCRAPARPQCTPIDWHAKLR